MAKKQTSFTETVTLISTSLFKISVGLLQVFYLFVALRIALCDVIGLLEMSKNFTEKVAKSSHFNWNPCEWGFPLADFATDSTRSCRFAALTNSKQFGFCVNSAAYVATLLTTFFSNQILLMCSIM